MSVLSLMGSYILKRIFGAVPLLIGLLTVTFFVIRLAPGEPTIFYIQSDSDPHYTERIRSTLGLDKPLLVQYLTWIQGTFRGEFGNSFSKNAPVIDLILDTIPNTLLLTSFALLFNILIGSAIGIATAVKRGTGVDSWITSAALFIYSMPEFWLGLMLVLVFSEKIPIFPASGMFAPFAEDLPPLDFLLDVANHMVLPVFVLGVASAAATARYMRGSLVEILHKEYIRTARAKGLTEFMVIGKHALRNALIPIITLIGLSLPFLIGGAVIVESIFAWPGMGKLTVDAIFSRDYPLIVGCTLSSGVLVVLGNLFADILYALVDPRIRLE